MHTVPLTPRLSAHVLPAGPAARIRLEGRLELAAIHPLIALLVGDRWHTAILDVSGVATAGDVALAALVSELEALWLPRVRLVGLGADEKRLLESIHVGHSVVA